MAYLQCHQLPRGSMAEWKTELKCKKCGHDVARVLETGEVEEDKERIQAILSEK